MNGPSHKETEQQKTKMEHKPAANPLETIDSFLTQAITKAELAAATCVGIHRAMFSPEAPEEPSPWHPFKSREEWQEFDAASDRWLKKRAAQERSAA